MGKPKKGVLMMYTHMGQDKEEAMGLPLDRLLNLPALHTSVHNMYNNYWHLMINSFQWDVLYLFLNEPVEIAGAEYFPYKFKEINIQCTEEVAKAMLNTICKLYPDKAPQLRKAKMMNKEIMAIVKSK